MKAFTVSALMMVMVLGLIVLVGCDNSQSAPATKNAYSVNDPAGNTVKVTEKNIGDGTWNLDTGIVPDPMTASQIQKEFMIRHGNLEVTNWVAYIENGDIYGYTVHTRAKP